MLREAQSIRPRTQTLSLKRLCRTSRVVLVKVLDGAHEVDSFQASSPESLRAALRPVYRHLPRPNGSVLFQGLEERRLPLGLGHSRREVEIGCLEAALAFLA